MDHEAVDALGASKQDHEWHCLPEPLLADAHYEPVDYSSLSSVSFLHSTDTSLFG